MRKLLLILMFLLAAPAWATTYYIATTGDNTTGDGSIGTPWRTLEKALENMSANDTVLVRGGTYDSLADNLQVNALSPMPTGTSWTNAINISAYPAETPVFQETASVSINIDNWDLEAEPPHYYIFTGITWDAWDLDGELVHHYQTVDGTRYPATHFRFNSCTFQNSIDGVLVMIGCKLGNAQNHLYWEFLSCTFQNTDYVSYKPHGLYLAGSNNLANGCTFTNIAGYGAHVWLDDSTIVDDNVIRNCVFTDVGENTGAGIGLFKGSRNLAYNNTITTNASATVLAGIWIGGLCTDCQAYNNTINPLNGRGIRVTTSTGAVLYNNVIIGVAATDYGIYVEDDASGTLVYSNTFYGVTAGTGIYLNGSAGHEVVNPVVKNNISYNWATNYSLVDATVNGETVSNNSTDGTNPNFVAAGTDFHLTASSAACLNLGAVLGSPYNTDKDAVTRCTAAYDIGAYEYGACGGTGGGMPGIIVETPHCDPVNSIRQWVSTGIVKGSWSVSSASGLILMSLQGKKLTVIQ